MQCPKCGLINPQEAQNCDCGYNFKTTQGGKPISAVFLRKLQKWNWAAFLLPIIWGPSFGVHEAFLVFVPVVGILAPFYLGIKGNELAWKRGEWRSIEEFENVQRKWGKGALIVTGLVILILISVNFI